MASGLFAGTLYNIMSGIMQGRIKGGYSSHRMLRTPNSASSKLQLLLDIAIVEALLFLLVWAKGADPQIYSYPAIIIPALIWLIYSNSAVYRQHPGTISEAMSVIWAWSKAMTVLIVWAYLAKGSEDYSRQVIIIWYIAGGTLQITLHIGINYLMRLFAGRMAKVPCLMVGDNKLGAHLAKHINANPWSLHKIVGFISDNKDDKDVSLDLPCLGTVEELYEIIKKYNVRRVYFTLPMKDTYRIRQMGIELLDLNVDVVWAPDIFALPLVCPCIDEVVGVPLYYLSQSPLTVGARISKMLMDKTLGIIALFVFSPLMVMAAVAVKFSSPGPVFFVQERHGLDGRIIRVLKFRSMKLHEEPDGTVTQAVKSDARITRVGRFLRKTSIDELPQLFNVLKGDMSLVGPRPHAKAHNKFYSRKISAYMARHRIFPGMTGLAQVNGCRGETETLEKMQKRVEYDLVYINNWSIWLDIYIMMKTIHTLLSKNAY